jgi:hypothetical protein
LGGEFKVQTQWCVLCSAGETDAGWTSANGASLGGCQVVKGLSCQVGSVFCFSKNPKELFLIKKIK